MSTPGQKKQDGRGGAGLAIWYHPDMREPNLRTSRLAIAGGLVAALALAGGGFLLGRSTSPRPDSAPPPALQPAPPPPATQPEPPHILGRADLVALAAKAADAATSGQALPTGLQGKRFELVLPFGCAGPAAADSAAPVRWRYDAAQQTLRVHVAPARWSLADWGLAPDTAGGGTSDEGNERAEPKAGEAAGQARLEGFWIERPWSSAETCPPVPAVPAVSEIAPPLPTEQTLALAQWRSEPGRTDTARAGRAYDLVKRLAPDAAPGPKGLRIRLIGRVARLPDGGSLRCTQAAGPDQRPVCLLAVTLDEVRIENPADGAVLGTWAESLVQP